MKWPDGSVVMHAAKPYDPVAAREYYLRTRRLKGRRRAAASQTTAPERTRSTFAVRTSTGGTTYLTPQQLAERKAAVAARVQAMQKKLIVMQKALKEKMAKAERADRESRKPQSASERARAAREARKYRDKNQQRLKTQRRTKSSSSGMGGSSVDSLTKSITAAKRSLVALIDQQKALSGATKNG